jgi:hypothetical protein
VKGDEHMRVTSIYKYYAFGYNYSLISPPAVGMRIRGVDHSLETLVGELFGLLDELDLRVTRGAAQDLDHILDDTKKLDDNAVVDAALASRVNNAINKLDTTLDAELQLRRAFIVTPKRFDLEHLLGKWAQLVSTETDKRLPQIARFDFGSACLCIAYALPTAAAFHLMRCLEAMLREYYCALVKRDRVQKLMWYDMVEHLRKRKNAPPKSLLDHLDHIRENFRNPTQHPEARYDLDLAQDLLNVVIEALNRISRDLATRGVAPASPSKH